MLQLYKPKERPSDTISGLVLARITEARFHPLVAVRQFGEQQQLLAIVQAAWHPTHPRDFPNSYLNSSSTF